MLVYVVVGGWMVGWRTRYDGRVAIGWSGRAALRWCGEGVTVVPWCELQRVAVVGDEVDRPNHHPEWCRRQGRHLSTLVVTIGLPHYHTHSDSSPPPAQHTTNVPGRRPMMLQAGQGRVKNTRRKQSQRKESLGERYCKAVMHDT